MENTNRSNVNVVVVGAGVVPTYTAILLFTNSPESSPPASPKIYPTNMAHPKAEKINKNLNKYSRPRSKSVPYKRENYNFNRGRKN